MIFSTYLEEAIEDASRYAQYFRNEYVSPETLLFAFSQQDYFEMAFNGIDGNLNELTNDLKQWMDQQGVVPEGQQYIPDQSFQYQEAFKIAAKEAEGRNEKAVDVPHLVMAMLQLEDSVANFLLHRYIGDDMIKNFIPYLFSMYEEPDEDEDYSDITEDFDPNMFNISPGQTSSDKKWTDLVTCISDHVSDHNPLIGREKELERTIEVLCRKEKNNPLHVGEPGVGKTSLVYGLAQLINDGKVPERLKNARIYSMDMGQMLAGAQYRGDFEERIKKVMDGAAEEGNAIIYLDEIHNIIGAGRVSDGGPDASNILKPYLESGEIRFIGSTTYEEYNRYFAKSKGIVRRFQQIDVKEPSTEEALHILEGLVPSFEEYHQVSYQHEAVEYAVEASAKHITNRYLPDKAVDLIDEAGAYLELHPTPSQEVDKALIQQILTQICKIDAVAMKEDNNDLLQTLQARMLDRIYGQNEAVDKVVESVMMSKAGLIDDDKPLASLLFVGPTGVGKTEVAKVLAQELGVELVRFDMSEYTEKHTVAKLIGSPAGYVGYEDGGLLTDAIRKTPNCVLLLDEIEKAHTDIYNILLQVMDYARLTDNRGQKADFRNVVLIMTSNAGAQYASQASVGFSGNTSRGEAMLTQVKKTFKPEFLNRLSDTIVFHDMDKQMAELILMKKIHQLEVKLQAKQVTLQLSDQAKQQLLEWGFTKEYGAREMDRVINSRLKPLLMKAILFGNLKNGGIANIELEDSTLIIK